MFTKTKLSTIVPLEHYNKVKQVEFELKINSHKLDKINFMFIALHKIRTASHIILP